jgi:hypothetical protein
MKPETVFRLLAHGQTRLNQILILTWAVKALCWTGITTGVIILFVRLIGWPGVNLYIWSLFNLAGGLVGLIIGWTKRLNQNETAYWLDEYLHDEEALSAALFCLQRDCSGLPDPAIIERADLIAGQKTKIHWPLHHLTKRISITAMILICIGLIIGSWLPKFHIVVRNTANPYLLKKGTAPKKSPQKVDQDTTQSAQEIAKLLFPQDEKMARQVEKALREGDVSTVESLLKLANMNLEKIIAKSSSPAEKKRFQDEQQMAQTMLNQLSNDNNNSEQNNQSGGNNSQAEDNQQNFSNEQNQNDQKKGNGKGKPSPNQVDKSKYASGSTTPEEMEDSSRGLSKQQGLGKGKTPTGTLAGKGEGTTNGKWNNLTARSDQKKAIIQQSKDNQMLEFILEGKTIRVPISQMLPASDRAVEAALAKENMPIEYEDFIRSYFLQLTQQLGNGSKEDQK